MVYIVDNCCYLINGMVSDTFGYGNGFQSAVSAQFMLTIFNS